MSCPKYHGFCDTFGAVQCGGDCARCKDRTNANALTLGEWERVYLKYAEETKAIRPHTAKGNVSCLHSLMSVMKLTADTSMASIDKSVINQFYATATHLQPTTRKGVAESLQRMSSERFCEWAKARGMTVTKMPSTKGLNGNYERYRQISESSMKRLRDYQWELKQSNNPRKWLMLTLALDYGMSKVDVLTARWSIIEECDGVKIINYCRNKTGKRAQWKVSDEHAREFARAEKLMREMKVQKMEADTADFILRVSHSGTSATSTLWNEMNAELRKIIPEWRDCSKAMHNCRKEFATMVCRRYGWEVGEIATGDTVKILQKSYVGKLIINWKEI